MQLPNLFRLVPVVLMLAGSLPFAVLGQRDTLRGGEITFTENRGQWDDRVLYKVELHGGSVYLERNGFTYDLRDQEAFSRFAGYKSLPRDARESTPVPGGIISHFAYKVQFDGARPNPEVTAARPRPDIQNYFLGNDPSRWASSVRRYEQVTYHDLYSGIDLMVVQDETLFKYEFHCRPGSDPGQIRLNYDGVQEMRLRHGNLFIYTPFGRVFELKPYAYQIIGDKEVQVDCRFKLRNNTLTYVLGKYDPSLPLVIDPPVRIFASYTGSTSDNWGYTATYDDLGHLYAGGNTFGSGYPTTTGAYQVNYGAGSCDIVITKFDTTGASLIYSTYLGGSNTEVPHSLVVNNLGQLYVLGTTGSANFPVTPGAFSTVFSGGTAFTLTSVLQYTNGSDIVLSKLSHDGTQLLSSTYVGGSANDGLNYGSALKHNYADEVRGEVLIDDLGNVMVVSSTRSLNFPVTAGALQTTSGGLQDAVVFKMDNQLSSMIWSTYLGGSGYDAGYSIVADGLNAVYVAGGTTSQNFPVTPGVVQGSWQGGTADGWIAKISPNGQVLQYSTYYGSSAYDQVYFVEQDAQENVYVLGQTAATGTHYLHNALWFTPSGGQFISKFNPSLSQKVWSTAFGTGTGPDISPTAFLVDLCNRVYLSGWGGQTNNFGGTSGLPVTPDAFQLTTDNSDYYFMIMQDDASALLYATFYGGPFSREHVDGGTSRFDKKGRIYQAVCAGCGGFSDFPTSTGVWSNTNLSTNCNMGVVVFDFHTPALVADFIDPPSICAPDTISFVNTSQIPNPANTIISWDFGNGQTSNQLNPVVLYTQPGVYQVTLILSDLGSCNFWDTVVKQVVVLSGQSSVLPPAEVCVGGTTQIGILPINDPNVTYQWTPTLHLNNGTISNPLASAPSTIAYQLMVSNGICTDTFNQQFIVYDLSVNAGPDTAVCAGSLTLTATGNHSPVMYHWSDNPNFTTMLNTTNLDPTCVITLNTPQYYYVMMYNHLCDTKDSLFVDQIVKFATVNPVDPNCYAVCDGSVTVAMATGAPPFTYQWSNSPSTSHQANQLCAGAHYVTVTDANGCIGVTQFVLTDPPLLESMAWAHNAPCADVCIGRGFVTPTGGTPPYLYIWNDPLQQQSNPANALCPGTYGVTVTDSRGCVTTDHVVVEDSSIYILLTIMASRDTVFEGQKVQLTATNLGTGYSYLWTPSTWLSNNKIFNPVSTPYGNIEYHLLVKDKWGCEFTAKIMLVVLEVICDDPYIFVPNAFTPNGDGVNDILYVYSLYADELFFAVYNRWGEKVFETRDLQRGWDGTYKGREADPGVFDYYLEVRCFNQQVFRKKGNITLIR
jgi:gliding motility-associated-like protein